MPNHPVPIERKRLLGNPGHRPLPSQLDTISLPAGKVSPLRPLGSAGLKLWNDVFSAAETWISPQSDTQLLQLVCEQLDRRTALLRLLEEEGFDRSTHMTVLDLEKQIASNLGTLGLTPTDRSRLGVAEVHKSSKLDEMLEKRARRDVKSSEAKSADSSSLLEENHDI